LKNDVGQSLTRVFYLWCTERCTVFQIFILVLDLTYPFYMISKEREKVKGASIYYPSLFFEKNAVIIQRLRM